MDKWLFMTVKPWTLTLRKKIVLRVRDLSNEENVGQEETVENIQNQMISDLVGLRKDLILRWLDQLERM